jgi:O-antigen/teichoic acid export membrane protein
MSTTAAQLSGEGPAPAARPGLWTLTRRVLRSRELRQAGLYSGSNVLISGLGAVATALLARHFTTHEFGSYSFAASFLQFVALFFEFGLFLPAARLAAKTDAETGRVIVGASLIAFIPVGIAFGGTIALSAIFVNQAFHVTAADALLITAPLVMVWPFVLVGQQLAQGVDRLHTYSITAAVTQVLFVGLIVVASVASLDLGITSALLLRCGAMLVGSIALVIWLRPVFSGARAWLPKLVTQAREYGFRVYVGRILSIGTYNMDVLMLGALTNARIVGFYALAGALTFVVGLPASALAAALFPRMAREQRIQNRWVLSSVAIGLAGVLAATLLAHPFVELVFSKRYLPAADLVLPLALAAAIRGVTMIYNSFLSAQARGKELRNAGLILTVSNLVLNFALIPPFGAEGAAWASFLALVANFLAHVVAYRRSLADEARDLPTETDPS